MSERRDVWSEVLSKASSVKVRNVMNPLLWLNAVAVPPLLFAASLFKEELFLSVPMILAAIAVPGWTLFEYRYFARQDPQRLQSEEYLIEQQRLMLQSKSSRDPVDATALPAGANPEFRELIEDINPVIRELRSPSNPGAKDE